MLLKNKRIFIVEDQVTYMAIAATYLRFEGAEVESEPYWQNAVQAMLKCLPIDLIMMDLVLSANTSGLDLFDQIRQIPELAHIPIVAISSADPESTIPKLQAKGFSGFIGKPISPSIVNNVAAVLDGQQVWTSDNWEYWSKDNSRHWGQWNQ
jgi:CheY-like chemotaxis protein